MKSRRDTKSTPEARRRAPETESPGAVSDLESRFFLVAMIAVLGTAIIAFLPHSNWWWGANLLLFYPIPVRAVWILLFLAAFATLRFRPRVVPETVASDDRERETPSERSIARISAAFPALIAVLASGFVFHVLRARSFLLGDGTHIVIHLARHEPPAPRSALYNVLETELTTLLRGSRGIPTLAEAGFLSTLVGAILMGLAVWILMRRARAVSPASAGALAVLVLLQPSMQLFFGYVEAYALIAAPLILFFLLAFDVAERRRDVWTTALPVVTALVAHPFGATTLPAFLLLLVRSERRVAFRRLLAVLVSLAGLVGVLFIVFQIWPAGRAVDSPVQFLAPQEYGSLLERVLRNIMRNPPWSRLYNTWSVEHWADVANHLWLTGAPALVVLLALGLARSGRRALLTFPVAVAVAGSAGAVLIRFFLRTVLGAVRDWDLFAVAGIGLTAVAATALALWVASRQGLAPPGGAIGSTPPTASRPGGPAVPRMVAGAALISVFFLAPWIGLQTNVDRAAGRHLAIVDARPELEPIAAGDFHAAMGDRLFFIGQYSLAGRAYEKAYQLWPTYMHSLRAGQSYMAAGQLERAVVAMHRALKEQPDDRTALTELGNILNGLNAFDLADSILTRTIALYPDQPLARLHRTRTLAMMGREREARAMLESARPLMRPGDPALGDFGHLDTLVAGRPDHAPEIPAP